MIGSHLAPLKVIVTHLELQLHIVIVRIPNVSRDIRLFVQVAVKLRCRDQPVIHVRLKIVLAHVDVEEGSPLVREFNIVLNLFVALAVARVDEDELVTVHIVHQGVLVYL